MKRENSINKRGQITIFVILAIIIISVLVIMFIPRARNIFITQTPGEMIPRTCIENAVRPILEDALIHGGSLNPQLYFRYNNQSIEYLCYTSEWYKTCIMQKPKLKQSIDAEIKANVQKKVSACISDMETKLADKGYSIKVSGTRIANIELAPKKVIVSPDISLVISKGDETQTLSSSMFQTEFASNSYELVMIATSILNYEARYGNTVTESYMSFYPNLKIEKKTQSDGTRMYILTDRDTEEVFQFATRSLAWPPGFDINSAKGAVI